MNGYRIINQNALHFVTFTIVGWIDVFTRRKHKDIVIESLKLCLKEKGLLIYAYVIMSNHIHLIVQAEEGINLSDIIRDFKKYTSYQITNSIQNSNDESRKHWMLKIFMEHGQKNSNNEVFQFWQRSNKPIELISPKWINQKINYIHQNPVKAGIVEEGHHYINSSASSYINQNSILDVLVLDLDQNIIYIV